MCFGCSAILGVGDWGDLILERSSCAGTCDFREKSLILERTIGVASMEVQGVGSLPSQIHFLLYIVALLVRFVLIHVLFKAFSGRMLEHTPPSLESRA